jgi:hypothetical protein
MVPLWWRKRELFNALFNQSTQNLVRFKMYLLRVSENEEIGLTRYCEIWNKDQFRSVGKPSRVGLFDVRQFIYRKFVVLAVIAACVVEAVALWKAVRDLAFLGLTPRSPPPLEYHPAMQPNAPALV